MPFWNLFKSRYPTLAKQYLQLSVGIVCLVLLLCTLFSYYSYRSYEDGLRAHLHHEGIKLMMDLEEKIHYADHVLQFIGTKIRLNSDFSQEGVAKVIQHHRKNFQGNTFSWHFVSFITPDEQLIASSINGKLTEPLDFPAANRPWMYKAQKDYWTIKFSKPDIGVISGDTILPAGLGVYDKKTDKFIGYLAVGISIEKLTNNLVKAVDENTAFIILDEDRNIISASEQRFWYHDIDFTALTRDDEGKFHLTEQIVFGDFIFSELAFSGNYPFFALIGRSKSFSQKEFYAEILPKVTLYIILGLIFGVLVTFLGYRAVRPLIELGRAADAISKGKNYTLPKYRHKELQALSHQLGRISIYNKELRHKESVLNQINQDLQNANEFIKSNMSFLSHELINPIASLIGFSKLLSKKVTGKTDKDTQDIVDMIEKTALYQQKQLTFFLQLFQFQEAGRAAYYHAINLKEIIEWNISMIMHHAAKKNVKIKMEIAPELIIRGDEIMIGQLIQNLASNGVKYNKQGGMLTINAYHQNDQVVVDFIDTGIGIAEADLTKIFNIFTQVKSSEISDNAIGYGLGLTFVQKCVQAHNGHLHVESKLDVGSTFSVIFPAYGTKNI